jgi:hypothetical protein
MLSHIKYLILKEAIVATISRRVFITLPIVIYLSYKYGDDFYMPMATEAIIFGFFGSIIHDYIIKLMFYKQQIKR